MLRSRRGGHEARRVELVVQLDKERAEPSEDWQVLRLGRANDNLRQAACWCTHCDDSAKARPTFC